MTDLEQRRADRLRVMKLIYEEAGGSQLSTVSGPWLLEASSLDDEVLGDVCKYLIGEHLITGSGLWGHRTPFTIMLTHRGIKEIERSLAAPDRPTEYFPPVNVISISGTVTGSAIQVSSPGGSQVVVSPGLDLNQVRTILEQYELIKPDLGLPDDDLAQLAAEMMTVRTQLEAPKPNQRTMLEHLSAAADILKLAAGGAAATGLIDLITLVIRH
jgi:hypothetical protein